MTRYRVVYEGAGGKEQTAKYEADGMASDGAYVRILQEKTIKTGPNDQAAATLVAMFPRERVIVVERDE